MDDTSGDFFVDHDFIAKRFSMLDQLTGQVLISAILCFFVSFFVFGSHR